MKTISAGGRGRNNGATSQQSTLQRSVLCCCCCCPPACWLVLFDTRCSGFGIFYIYQRLLFSSTLCPAGVSYASGTAAYHHGSLWPASSTDRHQLVGKHRQRTARASRPHSLLCIAKPAANRCGLLLLLLYYCCR